MMGGAVQAEISACDRERVYEECIGSRPGGSGGMKVKVKACYEAHDAGATSVHIASPDQNWLGVIEGRGETGKVTKVVQ
jgi:acetylglutamate kinase